MRLNENSNERSFYPPTSFSRLTESHGDPLEFCNAVATRSRLQFSDRPRGTRCEEVLVSKRMGIRENVNWARKIKTQ